MPELPEVEAERRFVTKVAVDRVIESVNALEQGGGPREGSFDDKIIAEGVTSESFVKALVGRRVVAARRKGKQLWLELDKGLLLVHNGMTGALLGRGWTAPHYKNQKFSDEWPPKFCKFELVLSDGGRLCYCDSRRFGRVLLRDEVSPPISDLAPDPLEECPPLDAFRETLAKKTAAIKTVLLDQRALVCGVGNWVADEVLFQAGVHPASVCNKLADDQLLSIRTALVDVCRVACDADADSDKFPQTWLFHHRWANQTSGSKSSPLGTIHFDTIGGRTTAFVPTKQRKPPSLPATTPKEKKPAAKKKRGKKDSAAAVEEAEKDDDTPKRRRSTRARTTAN